MICNLFSSFDPSLSSINHSYQIKWLLMMIPLFLFSWNFFISHSGPSLLIKNLFLIIIDMMKLVYGKCYKSSVIFITSLFITLLILNEFGMIPYSFTPTSHLVFNLSLSIPLWLSGIIFMFSKSFLSAISHFVPSGSPLVLVPFLILIETISLFIRPFSLSVRLMSNIMAGHMIMTLVGNLTSSSFVVMIPSMVIQSGLMMFEIMVVIIQSYVFMSLMSLYWQENN